jgi:PadR family transcriptional regulator PadR
MRKGILEYCILLIMENKSVYASNIIKILQEAQLIIVEGTLYPLLMRLKNSGLLSYQWVESTQGPPRKYYTLTEEGKLILSELETAWSDMNETIHLLKNKQSN